MSALVDSLPALCSLLPVGLVVTGGLTALLAGWLGRRVLWLPVAVLVFGNVYIATLQAYVLLHPGFDVLYAEPDPVLGWKQVPDFEHVRTGWLDWAPDYSVTVRPNSLGFRDLERSFEKEPGTLRIALLGASMIEAAQVPFEQTAGQVLEARLRAEGLGTGPPPARVEVLNFGVPAHGTGQVLLVWEEYASRFHPDFVFVYVSPHTFHLTVEELQKENFTGAKGRELQARPMFRLVDGELRRSPPRDYEAFVAAQRQLIETEYGGARSRRRHYSVLRECVGGLRRGWPGGGCPGPAPAAPVLGQRDPLAPGALELNLRILAELAKQVRTAGGKLILVDAARVEDLGRPRQRQRLMRFCAAHEIGYVPFHAELLEAYARGESLVWAHDIHFNEAGNARLAEAMHRWLTTHARRRSSAQPRGASAQPRGASSASRRSRMRRSVSGRSAATSRSSRGSRTRS